MNIDLRDCELVGHIGVDSGQMMLADPCYVRHFKDGEEFDPDGTPDGEFSYNGACKATINGKAGILGNGVAALGAVCSTGFGDGMYAVFIQRSDEGVWGERVKSMTIVFIEDDEDEGCVDCGAEFDIGFDGLCDDCRE